MKKGIYNLAIGILLLIGVVAFVGEKRADQSNAAVLEVGPVEPEIVGGDGMTTTITCPDDHGLNGLDCFPGDSFILTPEDTTRTVVIKVFCPVCVEKGLKSTVRSGMSTRTAMDWFPYYNEDGAWHSDDPNIGTTKWYCSQGHEWTETCQHGNCSQSIQE